MKIFSIVILVLVISMLLGTALRHLFDKLTMAKDWDISTQPWWFVLLYMLFSPIMFLLYRPIREYRKLHYMKCKVRHYEFWILAYCKNEIVEKQYFYDEYVKYKRYLLLKELSKKTKKRKIWN